MYLCVRVCLCVHLCVFCGCFINDAWTAEVHVRFDFQLTVLLVFTFVYVFAYDTQCSLMFDLIY